jgi:hypothetical protein
MPITPASGGISIEEFPDMVWTIGGGTLLPAPIGHAWHRLVDEPLTIFSFTDPERQLGKALMCKGGLRAYDYGEGISSQHRLQAGGILMPVSIDLTLNMQVAKGPNMALSSHLEVDAYDKIEVTIDAAAKATVELQPGGVDQVRFLLMRSTEYGDTLTYKVNDDANPAHALNDFLLLIGHGSVALLGFPPKSLLFSNGLAQNATIEILIGRHATI